MLKHEELDMVVREALGDDYTATDYNALAEHVQSVAVLMSVVAPHMQLDYVRNNGLVVFKSVDNAPDGDVYANYVHVAMAFSTKIADASEALSIAISDIDDNGEPDGVTSPQQDIR